MALAGVELRTLVSETDALTTRPPPCAILNLSSVTFTEYYAVRSRYVF